MSVYRKSEYVGEVVWMGVAPAGQGLRSGRESAFDLNHAKI